MAASTTTPPLYFPTAIDLAVFDEAGPRPQFLVDSEKLKVIVAGLESGQEIPVHPETLAVYTFLAGSGVMTVDDQAFAITAGAVVVAPPGAARGLRADDRLIFLAAKSGL
ncbi:MAG: hypothetical protein KDD78_05400 [Caldilineaceae bacterium]|nr:hypothetical protein [Caldilineaceae bacterium]